MNPTYDHKHSPQRWDVITEVLCLSISTFCVGMRMYTKLLITRAPGWEDFYAVMTFETGKHGSGLHQWEVSPSDLREFLKLANTCQIIYGPIIFITKLSILLLFLRVFAPSFNGITYLLIQLLIWLNFLFYFADTILKIFECTPRSKIWDEHVPGHCININGPILAASIFNVVSDFLILLLPIVCVWRLQMTFKKKICTSAVFVAGIFGCISSVMRLVVSIPNSTATDNTFVWFPEFLWTTITSKKTVDAKPFPVQHRQNISLTDLLPGNNLEMLSRGNRSGKTYETTCYTTVEASPVEKGREDHSKEGDSSNRGILKTIESIAILSAPRRPSTSTLPHQPRRQTSPTVEMAQERSGIVVGLNKGHKTTPLNTPKTRVSRTKGQSSRRTAFVRDIAREVVGLAPYERRIIELLRNTQDKRARKLAKKRLGTFGRGKRKVEDMQRVIAESRRVTGH
ncbi:ribosomal protein L36e-domain-containing protein [Aspergillus caelatus]|uniref:60S ribosomal protein L36 n=1 Tax=Aspergillus caelatus TaxID=61420 RepID=A0A5N6ZYM5_9EURO|nr:ribosomal protein L36e-domain-containing protein [Aspergillus caelatus]KAE8362039.1 ribosomal protein L36e-domain-containing protein [Aspergillus caelatus]